MAFRWRLNGQEGGCPSSESQDESPVEHRRAASDRVRPEPHVHRSRQCRRLRFLAALRSRHPLPGPQSDSAQEAQSPRGTLRGWLRSRRGSCSLRDRLRSGCGRATTALRHALRRVLLLHADAVLRLLGAAGIHELLPRARQLLFPQGLLVRFVRPPLLQLTARPRASRRALPGAPQHEERRLTLRRAETRREGRGPVSTLGVEAGPVQRNGGCIRDIETRKRASRRDAGEEIAMLARQVTEALALGAEHEGERLRQ